MAQARAQAGHAAGEVRDAAVRQYDGARAAVSDVAHTVERKYEDAAGKTKAEAQGWNAWFWSWFGYGKGAAEDAKRKAAQKVAEGAREVEKEAGKRA